MMEQQRRSDAIRVARLTAAPSESVIELFRRSFPRHPVSQVDSVLASAFLGAYALRSILLVAQERESLRDVGFLIGGDTLTLDRTRVEFIRKHALRIASNSTRSRSLFRLLLMRLRPARSFATAPYFEYQLRFIAVDPQARGLGIGALLVKAFEDELRPSLDGYHTWTMLGERGAEGFFTSLGFVRDVISGDHVRLRKSLR